MVTVDGTTDSLVLWNDSLHNRFKTPPSPVESIKKGYVVEVPVEILIGKTDKSQKHLSRMEIT